MGEVAATKTPATAQQVADALVAAWPGQLGGTPTLGQVCLLVAQWSLETGNGADFIQWNVGNAKWNGSGDYCSYPTEEYIAGVPTMIYPPDMGCRFQAYESLEQGVLVYLHGMWSRWTSAWPHVANPNPELFAAGLKAQGYFTAPVEAYAAGVRARFDSLLKTIVLAHADTIPPSA